MVTTSGGWCVLMVDGDDGRHRAGEARFGAVESAVSAEKRDPADLGLPRFEKARVSGPWSSTLSHFRTGVVASDASSSNDHHKDYLYHSPRAKFSTASVVTSRHW